MCSISSMIINETFRQQSASTHLQSWHVGQFSTDFFSSNFLKVRIRFLSVKISFFLSKNCRNVMVVMSAAVIMFAELRSSKLVECVFYQVPLCPNKNVLFSVFWVLLLTVLRSRYGNKYLIWEEQYQILIIWRWCLLYKFEVIGGFIFCSKGE